MWRLPERSKIVASTFKPEGEIHGGTLISFHGRVRDDLIRHFRETYHREARHIKTGGRLAAQCFGTITAGGAAWGWSSQLSSQLFIATANVDTLMKIGAGVGSQVVAGGQIVAQAPFMAASSAVMPIAAPILLFQAMTTVMIMNEFRLVHDKLNELHRGINRVLQRNEANHITDIISASVKIEEIESQLLTCKEFTPSMVMRLCVLEDKVSSIVERYRFFMSKNTSMQL
jgi:hypothetical protein